MNLQELLATGACARIGGGDDAHSSRTSRSSRLARAHEARITARLDGRRPAGCARARHGSQLVGRGCAFATCAINPECAPWSELSWGGKQADFARVCVFCTRKRQQASEALDSARVKAGTVLNFIPAFSYFSTEAITCVVISRENTCTNAHPLEVRPGLN
jgi:hypothetical protein